MKRRAWRSIVLAIGIGSIVCAPFSVAEAQDARALFTQGQEAYQQGSYETAIELWLRAYELEQRPALQYNLAQAYGRLARSQEEAAALRLFLEGMDAAGADPNDSQIENARSRLAALTERLRRTGIALANIEESDQVLVDGQALETSASAGGTISLEPGPHHVVVRRRGFLDFTVAVVVRAGEALLVPVVFTAMPEAAAAGERAPMGRVIGIGMLGVGGASFVTGGVLGLVAFKRSEGAIDGTSDASSARRLARAADVTLGLGVALAVTGVVLVVTSGGDDDGTSDVAVVPMIDRHDYGVAVIGRF
jgi:hypothetical protein